ncbi:5-deoxy-glucuronate isomerase [Halioxenophilus aromaticivorans]|uniref:5-deoxy-glucuronate isomerase n=1 Tax=Halioxenophilus aromaticivorans TaxID=1306992 RepID=A0AAV3TVH6_9ALTE
MSASPLLSKYCKPEDGNAAQDITPEKAGWQYVGFEVQELKAGDTISQATEDQEYCLVLVSGLASLTSKTLNEDNLGQRMSPFERTPPYSVYLPNDDQFTLTALTDVELAICKAPSKGTYPARVIAPADVGVEHRGKGFNKRFVQNILPEDKPADSLLVVEVFTDEGNTSSYPSHKHDQDNCPAETYLEETYYHRIDPPQGFVFQRVYTDDRSLDESMAVYDKDVVMVPKGYHPVATLAGYTSYYLNVMAGPTRRWCFTWEKDHNWVNGPDYK